jgi:GTP-binding protein
VWQSAREKAGATPVTRESESGQNSRSGARKSNNTSSAYWEDAINRAHALFPLWATPSQAKLVSSLASEHWQGHISGLLSAWGEETQIAFRCPAGLFNTCRIPLPQGGQPPFSQIMDHIRNIAIIAHVDHGKTTLVDQLLKQSGTFRANQAISSEIRIMDSMDLEREKGITIRAKNAAFRYKDYHVNIVDTPGHADFGGEVERIMKMIDGVLLVVDAHDGPQAQTKFVLKKALANGAKPIVVINKIDRENARPHKVLDMVFELFMELGADDQQLDFPVVYASARDGFAKLEIDQESSDMVPLFESIIKHIPAPKPTGIDHLQFLVSNLDYSDYLGRIAYGRIVSGKIAKGETVWCIHANGTKEKGTVTALFGHQGLAKIELQEASAGDIVGICGFEDVFIGETITDSDSREPLPFVDIDPPTITMRICINDGPLAGREGKLLTARQVKERLIRESRTNVSIQVAETDVAGHFEIKARGEMQIAILVEQMRREGFRNSGLPSRGDLPPFRQRHHPRAHGISVCGGADRKPWRHSPVTRRTQG